MTLYFYNDKGKWKCVEDSDQVEHSISVNLPDNAEQSQVLEAAQDCGVPPEDIAKGFGWEHMTFSEKDGNFLRNLPYEPADREKALAEHEGSSKPAKKSKHK